MADKNGYIGRAPSDSAITIARQVNTLSGIQTTFIFNSGYDVGYLDVYLNGTKLINTVDYTATDTGTVIFTQPGQTGDTIEFVAYKAFNLAKTVVETHGDLDVLGDLTAADIDSTGNISATGDITAGGSLTVGGSISGDGSTLSGVVTSITAGDNISVNQSTGSVTITGLANTANVVADTLVVTGVTTLGSLNATSGSFSGIVTATELQGDTSEAISGTWTLGADGTNHYTFTGPGLIGTENDPTLFVQRGMNYHFVNNMGAHPFQIQETQGIGGVVYNEGVTNNGVTNGTLTLKVQMDAPDTLYYQCMAHPLMGGKLTVGGGGGGAGLSTVGVSTGYIFSNPSVLNESADLINPGHNYAVFGPITIGAGVTITVGAGNTFTVA